MEETHRAWGGGGGGETVGWRGTRGTMSPSLRGVGGEREEEALINTPLINTKRERVGWRVVSCPDPARRGSGDIRLIPRASLKIHSLLYA